MRWHARMNVRTNERAGDRVGAINWRALRCVRVIICVRVRELDGASGKKSEREEGEGKIRRERKLVPVWSTKSRNKFRLPGPGYPSLYREVARGKLVCNSFEPPKLRGPVFVARLSYSTTNFAQKQTTNCSFLTLLPSLFLSISRLLSLLSFSIMEHECNLEYTSGQCVWRLNRWFCTTTEIQHTRCLCPRGGEAGCSMNNAVNAFNRTFTTRRARMEIYRNVPPVKRSESP